MPVEFTATPEDRFAFGLWTVGNRGRDPFGEGTRPKIETVDMNKVESGLVLEGFPIGGRIAVLQIDQARTGDGHNRRPIEEGRALGAAEPRVLAEPRHADQLFARREVEALPQFL